MELVASLGAFALLVVCWIAGPAGAADRAKIH